MTTCSESGQVRKEAAIRSLCRASESIERTGAFLLPRHGPAGGEAFGVSLVLGCACGIARLPNIVPPAGPNRPKITRKGAFI